MKLLVSGGVGYIGAHSIIEIMNAEHDISEIDDLSKSHIAALPWVKQNSAFVQADLCDTVSLVR
ncbi:NAD-dependent epimerase/dehydratase family protein [Paracoccaceae bacterium]|nr:NAD-dependent epimerase/dehydratase family protein [Paracoccaceae bacterium]